jgi:hypothetical protein
MVQNLPRPGSVVEPLMTTPADIRWLLARVQNSANVIEARLPHAGLNTSRNQADGYPTTASGNANQGGRSKAELTPTEAAANTNLGDLYGYDTYKPGPTTRFLDLADELRAALTCLDRAHNQLTAIGVPPLITQQFRCRGVNAEGCTGWIDTNRSDRLCIDCGRSVDTKARRLRRHKTA